MQKSFFHKFLSEIIEKAFEKFLSEFVFPKIFRPKVFHFNAQTKLYEIVGCLFLF